MKFRNLLIPLLLSSLLFLVSLSGITAQEPDDQLSPELVAKIDPRIVKQFRQNKTDLANIMVIMRDRPDLGAFRQQPDLIARRQSLLSTLQTTAAQSQAGVRVLLAEAQTRQQAADIQPFWIVNRVAARAAWPTIQALAAREDVELVRLQESINLPPSDGLEGTPAGNGTEWGIKRIGAPDVWDALKIDGTGVVVANIDSGVDFLHPDLQAHYRGYRGGTLPAVHVGNWYDTTGDDTIYPIDLNGHGTHTMGSAVAANGVGVAPGAQWIAVRAFTSGGSSAKPMKRK